MEKEQTKMNDTDIYEIADHYGYEVQKNILVEECAELIQAISKYERYPGVASQLNLFAEIADVQIMIWQIKHLLNCNEEVSNFIESKIKRQMERIANSESR